MISRFWKKRTLFNAALLIIFLRIYAFFIDFLKEYCENMYIFPKVGENGYPFLESIQYNLDEINKITNFLTRKNPKILKPVTLYTTHKCSLKEMINICNNDGNCFEEIKNIKEGTFKYHENIMNNNKNLLNNDYILNLLKEANIFTDQNNNIIELPFYYKIIDGYSSYLSIQSDDITSIKKITNNEEKLNNLLFLYILYLKAYTYNYKHTTIDDLKELVNTHDDKINETLSSMDKLNIEQLIQFMSVDVKDKIINCIPDLDMSYSYFMDFKSLLSMIQSLLQIKPNNYEYRIFDFFLMRLTKAINYLFVLENKTKIRNQFFSAFRKYSIYIYWPVALIIIYYSNKYFIKKKEFYSKNQIDGNKLIDKAKYKKLLKYQRNIALLEKINKNRYSKDEVDMINKITSNQKDYIISK